MTGAAPTCVNIVFRTIDGNVEFINSKLRHKARIMGIIRAGRSAVTKESMISQINDAWIAIVGERCHLIGFDENKAENIAEDSIVVPAAGKEAEWLATNQKTFEERAEKGEEISKDFLADLEAMKLPKL